MTSQGKAFASNTTTGNLIAIGIALYRNTVGTGGVTSVGDGGDTFGAFTSSETNIAGDTNAYAGWWYAKNITGRTTPTVTVTPNASSFTTFSITEVSGLDTTSPEKAESLSFSTPIAFSMS